MKIKLQSALEKIKLDDRIVDKSSAPVSKITCIRKGKAVEIKPTEESLDPMFLDEQLTPVVNKLQEDEFKLLKEKMHDENYELNEYDLLLYYKLHLKNQSKKEQLLTADLRFIRVINLMNKRSLFSSPNVREYLMENARRVYDNLPDDQKMLVSKPSTATKTVTSMVRKTVTSLSNPFSSSHRRATVKDLEQHGIVGPERRSRISGPNSEGKPSNLLKRIPGRKKS